MKNTGLRNRLVGFGIVCTAVVLLLPLILSKDMLRRQNPESIAVNSSGALRDENGELLRQSGADLGEVLTFGGREQSAEDSQDFAESQSDAAAQASENLEFSIPHDEAEGSEEMLIAGTVEQSAQTPSPRPATRPASQAEDAVEREELSAPTPPVAQKKTRSERDEPKAERASKGRYVIQAAVFSVRSNADNLVKKLQAENISAFSMETASNGRTLYRVYAGSSDNRSELQSLVKRVDSLSGSKGRVVNRP